MPTTDDYNWWLSAIKGSPGPIYEDEPCCGFYRKRNPPYIDEQGKRRWGDFIAAAIWRAEDGDLVCRIDDYAKGSFKFVASIDEWTFLAKHPVSKAAYDNFMRTGIWENE